MLLVLVALPTLLLCKICVTIYLAKHPTIEEHVSPRGIAPSSASDVSYFDSVLISAYEFTISETDFRQWAKEKNWPVEEVSVVRRIRRYLPFRDDARGIVRTTDDEASDTIEIRNGLFYETPERHRGGFAVAFDRSTNRAYYDSNRN